MRGVLGRLIGVDFPVTDAGDDSAVEALSSDRPGEQGAKGH